MVGAQRSVGADAGVVGIGLSSMVHTATFTRAWLAGPAGLVGPVCGEARPKIVVVKTETVRRPVESV